MVVMGARFLLISISICFLFMVLMGGRFLFFPGSIISCPRFRPLTLSHHLQQSSRSQLQAIQQIDSFLKCDGSILNFPEKSLTSRYRLKSILTNCSFATSSLAQSKGMAGESEGVPSVVVYVTVPNKDTGRNLAKSIINAKLAACVNQVPGVESTYWWQGKVETDSEELLIIKTRESLLKALTKHVQDNHPYEVPEVIALPIVSGNPAYLKWLEESTKSA